MSFPAEVVMVWLGEQCLGLTPGENLFCGEWGVTSIDGVPTEVDQQVLVILSPVTPAELSDLNENVGVQVVARGDRNESASKVYNRIKDINDAILAAGNTVEMNCTCYIGWEKQGDILGLGKDENHRHGFSVNFFSSRNP